MASILKVDTIQDQDGNNIINESANTITIGASGDTITVPSGASMTGQNYPAFKALNNGTSTKSVSHSTWTEINIFDNENFDTDNTFNTSTGRFTPNVAGKYFLNASVFCINGLAAGFNAIGIIKNGSVSLNSANEIGYITRLTTGDSELRVCGILSMNGTTDYASVFVNQQTGSTQTLGGNGAGSEFYFEAYRIGA